MNIKTSRLFNQNLQIEQMTLFYFFTYPAT